MDAKCDGKRPELENNIRSLMPTSSLIINYYKCQRHKKAEKTRWQNICSSFEINNLRE